ncbi:hypothetical protein SEA_WATERT_105 [Microbacterium phage WaterT]|nr:hypothetical protein SEA_WATERT_105 [Microbacterium phage WaterT]USH44556.1 hypothetical protein SEA_CASSITA_103 [Microbacterium phage Cassita]
MAMFSSREPFNDDPEPYVDQWNIDRSTDGDPAGYDFDVEFQHDPRPEYNRPQHNPTNPVLLKLRSIPGDWKAIWVEGFLNADAEAYNWPNWTSMEIQHAYRVLTRLANLSN